MDNLNQILPEKKNSNLGQIISRLKQIWNKIGRLLPFKSQKTPRIVSFKSNRTPKIVTGVLIILLLVMVIVAFSFYSQWRDLKENPQKIAQKESRDLIAKISQLMVLPEGEEPVIATVTDPERLKDQVFFTKAKKGDKVLIYTNAKKAILYDPVANKIVEVAPLNIGIPPTTSATTPETK